MPLRSDYTSMCCAHPSVKGKSAFKLEDEYYKYREIRAKLESELVFAEEIGREWKRKKGHKCYSVKTLVDSVLACDNI